MQAEAVQSSSSRSPATKPSGSRREPTIVVESQPFLSRSQLLRLARPRFETIREAGSILWAACDTLWLPLITYTTSMLYVQRLLILNPDINLAVERGTTSISAVAGGALITAFMTEGVAKKTEDAARAIGHGVDAAALLEMKPVVLETNCFDFRIQHAPLWTVKFAKMLNLEPEIAHMAWLIASDAYETTAVLQFPAHAVAVASLQIAVRSATKSRADWNLAKFRTRIVPVQTSVRLILEFYARCIKMNLPVHASSLEFSRLEPWLISLNKSRPPPGEAALVVLRDPRISAEGTARFRAKRAYHSRSRQTE